MQKSEIDSSFFFYLVNAFFKSSNVYDLFDFR